MQKDAPPVSEASLCVSTATATLDGFRSFASPTYRATTIVFDDAASYAGRASRAPDGYSYGLTGTPTSKTLELRLAALERAQRCYLVPSGQAAVSLAMLAILKSGDHVMIPDSVYPPVRDLADTDLTRFGV